MPHFRADNSQPPETISFVLKLQVLGEDSWPLSRSRQRLNFRKKSSLGFRAAIEKMGLTPEEAVKLFFNEAVKLLAEKKYSVTPQKK